MENNPPASLIITTYNWPEALRLVLQSVLEQTMRPDQVIVADDGSGPETGRVVKDVLMSSGLDSCHVRHYDKGVRQSRIKNLAVRYTRFPYLIFIDHDVILHREFIADHLAMAKEGFFLQGKRALLPGYYTKKLLEEGRFVPPKYWTRGLGNRKNIVRSPVMGNMFSRQKDFETSLRGCNLSMFKSDFMKVDGFDETFDRSWGREDSDICFRLFHLGIRVKVLWFMALQYHLKHKTFKHWDKERLDRELGENIREKRVRAVQGFSRLSDEGGIVAASHGKKPFHHRDTENTEYVG